MMRAITIQLWRTILAAPALVASAPVLAQTGQQDYGNHMWDGGWFGWFAGPVMMIVFIAIAVVVVVLLVRWLGGAGHGHPTHPPLHTGRAPLDILRERYARGEIDREEFEERRRVLGD